MSVLEPTNPRYPALPHFFPTLPAQANTNPNKSGRLIHANYETRKEKTHADFQRRFSQYADGKILSMYNGTG